ncbi:MAG TPA: nucleotide exchange factor GrpE [Streptosporangiaceae bacterium]
MNSPEDTNAGPVIRDLRRIDPVTGQVRDPQGRRDGAPGKPARPGRHSVSKPGGTGARPAAPGGAAGAQPPGGADGGQPQGQPQGRPEGQPGEGQPQGPPAGGMPSAGQPGGPPPGGDRPGDGGPGAGQPGGAAGDALAAQLAERTADLQRVHAEYANYRKRVERDRLAVREQALANVLGSLIPVLDDIGRAREHGDLNGAFKSVGESLETIAAKLGLESFGEPGEPFDPLVHEALMHSYSPDVTEPTAVQILQPGYKVGERIIRPARVAVAEPSDGPAPDDQAEARQPRGTPAGNN